MELAEYLKVASPPYKWIRNKVIGGTDAFTQLEPWYFLPNDQIFDAAERWPAGRLESPLIAFARRQDCDDIACFDFTPGNNLKVLLIEGWTGGGNAYSVLDEYSTFWEWLKSAIDDIADWSSAPGKE